MKRIAGIALVLVLTLSWGLVSCAEEGTKASGNQQEPVALEWVMGIVKSVDVKNNSIEVSYYDFENDRDATVVVYVNENTEYLGSPSLKEINPGDDIEVSYTYDDSGKRIAEAVITAKFEDLEGKKESSKENKK